MALFNRRTPNAADPNAAVLTPQPRRWRRNAVAATVVVLCAGALIGWRASSAPKNEKKPEPEKVFEFAQADITRLKKQDLGQVIPVYGSVRPVVQALVRAKVPGEVARVLVREGERVNAGDTLITLDTRDLQAQLDSAQGSVAEARAKLDLAGKNEDNNRQLLAKGFISQNAFDAIANSVSVTTANLKSAEAQAAIARKALADAAIRAPFAGIVAKRAVNIGEKVSVDSPVAQIVDLTQMELEAAVPVAEIPYVKVGQEIAFKVDGFAGREFRGKVDRISPAADAGSRAISVFVNIPNQDGALKGGMFASGALATGGRGQLSALPKLAVREEGGQNFVLVVADGKVDRRPVTIGITNSERGLIEIREGLTEIADVIAVKGDGLKVGAKAILRSADATATASTPTAAPAALPTPTRSAS